MNGQELFPGWEAITTVPGAGDASLLGLPDPHVYAGQIKGVVWGGFVALVTVIMGVMVVRAVYAAISGGR